MLFGHPKVADVAVLGLADDERGEMVVRVRRADRRRPIRRRSPRSSTSARTQGLMTQKIPERLEILDVMPRNPSGKVPKHELRATLLANG